MRNRVGITARLPAGEIHQTCSTTGPACRRPASSMPKSRTIQIKAGETDDIPCGDTSFPEIYGCRVRFRECLGLPPGFINADRLVIRAQVYLDQSLLWFRYGHERVINQRSATTKHLGTA
jgi:hypothetical protein